MSHVTSNWFCNTKSPLQNTAFFPFGEDMEVSHDSLDVNRFVKLDDVCILAVF